jgi:hypothetical protein
MLRRHLRRYEPSWTGGGHGRPLQQPVQLAGDGPLQTAAELALAPAFGGPPSHIAPGRLVVALAEHDDGCRARFGWRSLPRFSRWRTTRPEEASIGAAPASMAKAASERSRPGCDQPISTCAAVTGPTPGWPAAPAPPPGPRWPAPCRAGQPPGGRPGPRLAQPGLAAQAGPQRLGRGHQQGLEVPAGIGGLDGTGPGELEHPAGPRAGRAAAGRQVLATQRLAAGPDRIQRVALAWVRPVRLGRALRGKGTSPTAGYGWATRATGVSLPCQAAPKATGSIVEDGRLRSEPLSLPAPPGPEPRRAPQTASQLRGCYVLSSPSGGMVNSCG